MLRKRIIKKIDQCEGLWKAFIRQGGICSLWEFRHCFHRHFQRPPHFVLLEDRQGVAGMIPLAYVEEEDIYVFFPGETWKGKTWIERTPVYLRDPDVLQPLLSACPERTCLRYLDIGSLARSCGAEVDEIGYVLEPPRMGYDISKFHGRFAPKKLKDIRKTISRLTAEGCTVRINEPGDFDRLVQLSIRGFGRESYLYDPRFREGFREISSYLERTGRLRMVTLEVNGRKVAVDLGALHNGHYTLFIGGTHPEFPGIAKVMNMAHIEFAFREKLSSVDFLCGDFHWKKLWHLDPQPLCKFVTPRLKDVRIQETERFEGFGALRIPDLGMARA